MLLSTLLTLSFLPMDLHGNPNPHNSSMKKRKPDDEVPSSLPPIFSSKPLFPLLLLLFRNSVPPQNFDGFNHAFSMYDYGTVCCFLGLFSS